MSDCKASVTTPDGWHTYPCSRGAKRDGYCTQHHPDNVAKRREAAAKRSEENWQNSTTMRLRRANTENAKLRAEVRHLQGLILAADHLLKAATGPNYSPHPWGHTYLKWRLKAKSHIESGQQTLLEQSE